MQFGRMDAKSSSIVSRAELNLPTLVLVLEGTLTWGGLPTKTLQAGSVTEETKKLEDLRLKDVKSNIQKQGWVMKLGPGDSLTPSAWRLQATKTCAHFGVSLDRKPSRQRSRSICRSSPAQEHWSRGIACCAC